MAKLTNLNNRLRTQQRPSMTRSLMRVGGSVLGQSARILSNAVHNESPGLDMFTGVLSGLAGSIHKGMFGKGEQTYSNRPLTPTPVRTRRMSSSSSTPVQDDAVVSMLRKVLETNQEILKKSTKTERNTKSTATSSDKAWRKLQESVALAQQNASRDKWGKQIKEGRQGDTKYKDFASYLAKPDAAGANKLKATILDRLKSLFEDPLAELYALTKLGPKAAGGMGSFLKKMVSIPVKGLGKGMGKGAEWAGQTYKDASLARAKNVRNSRLDKEFKKMKEIRTQVMRDNAPLLEKIEEQKKEIRQLNKLPNKGSGPIMEMKKNLRKEQRRLQTQYENTVAADLKARGIETRLKKVDQILDKYENKTNGEQSKFRKFLTGDKSLSNKFGKVSSDGWLGKLGKGMKGEGLLGTAGKGIKGLGKGLGAMGKMGTGALTGMADLVGILLFPMIGAWVGGIFAGFSEGMKNPKEWDKLKKDLKDHGLLGTLWGEVSGKNKNPILTKGFTSFWDSFWDVLYDCTIGLITQLIDGLFGDNLVENFENKVSKGIADHGGSWLKKKLGGMPVGGGLSLGDFYDQPNSSHGLTAAEQQNQALRAAKEGNGKQGDTIIQHITSAPSASSSVSVTTGSGSPGYAGRYLTSHVSGSQ